MNTAKLMTLGELRRVLAESFSDVSDDASIVVVWDRDANTAQIQVVWDEEVRTWKSHVMSIATVVEK